MIVYLYLWLVYLPGKGEEGSGARAWQVVEVCTASQPQSDQQATVIQINSRESVMSLS